MPTLSLTEVARIAANLGHSDLTVTETRRGRFIAHCSCGFTSESKLTAAMAAQTAAVHLEGIVRRWQASGATSTRRSEEQTYESRPKSIA